MSATTRFIRLFLATAAAGLVFVLSLNDAWSSGAQSLAAWGVAALLVVPFALGPIENARQRFHSTLLAVWPALLFVALSCVPYFVVMDRDPDRVTDPKLLWASAALALGAPVMLLGLLAWMSPRLAPVVSRWVLIGLGGVAVVFGVLEWSARGEVAPQQEKRPDGEEAWLIEQEDALPRFVLKPDHTFHNTFASNPRGYFDEQNRVAHYTNPDGYRGPQRSIEKPDDVFRILVLGDSTAYGWGVRDEHMISALLEERLGDEIEGKRLEAMVFAAPGYETRDQRDILQHKGLAYSPDLVILWYAINDVAGQWDPVADEAAKAEMAEQKPWLLRASVVLDRAARKVAQTVVVRRYNRDVGNYYTYDRENWRVVKAAIGEIRDLASGIGAETLVVIKPQLFPLGRDTYRYREAHGIIRQFCKDNDLPCYDLWEAIVDMDCRRLMVHAPAPADIHPNEIARELFADYLAEAFRRDGVLGGR